jgi:hypothetical protein
MVRLAPGTSVGMEREPLEKIASPPKTGVAGKRDPTTYVVNEYGEIGINSVEAKKTFSHERTVSVFA